MNERTYGGGGFGALSQLQKIESDDEDDDEDIRAVIYKISEERKLN